jgi:hypothetical protein
MVIVVQTILPVVSFKFQETIVCLHPTPPVSSVEEGIPVKTQSNDANAVPFPALPTHSNVCKESLHCLS